MYYKLIPFILSAFLATSANSWYQIAPQTQETIRVDAITWQDLVPENDTILRQVIKCESGGNINAIGKAGEVGLLQFMPLTWKLWTDKMDKDLDIKNPVHQIEVYNWAMKNGYAHSWTCFRKIFDIK